MVPCGDHQSLQKTINDNRQLITIAWIGKDAEIQYKLTINFGPKSQSRNAKDKEMIDCIPSSDNMDWIRLDIENEEIELWLL